MATRAPPHASSAERDNNSTTSAMDELQKEMASLIRVRNRLAQSPDAAMPKILTGLLPRLVEHLDRHTAALQQLRQPHNDNAEDHHQEEEERAVRTKLQGHVSGIWMHAMERIRGGVHTIPPGAPWVPPLLDLLQQQAVDWTDVTVAFVLSLLQTSLPRCIVPPTTTSTSSSQVATEQNAVRETKAWQQLQFLSTLTTLGALVDRMHQVLVAREQHHHLQPNSTNNFNSNDNYQQSREINFRSAGWLCIDVLALSWGLPVIFDWDKDHFDEYEWTTPTPFSLSDQAALAATSPEVAIPWLQYPGMFHLSLDLVLFWPDDPRLGQHFQRILHQAEHAVVDHNMGLSPAGIARLNHRCRGNQSWNIRYLRELKLACVNHIVEPLRTKQQCTDRLIVTRALLHCILTASSNSMHGKLALEFLNKSQYYWNNSNNMTVSSMNPSGCHGKNNARKRAVPGDGTDGRSPAHTMTDHDGKPHDCPYDLTFASCLLALVLGERVVGPIMRKYGTATAKIETILGHFFVIADTDPVTTDDDAPALDPQPPPARRPVLPAAHIRRALPVANGQHHNRAGQDRSSSSQFQRTPMPFGVAERAVEFVVTRLFPQHSVGRPEGFVDLKNTCGGGIILSPAGGLEDREALGLFVELVLSLKDQKGKLGAYWAMQILDGIYSQLPKSESRTGPPKCDMEIEDGERAASPDEWMDSFYQSSLEISTTVLSQIAQVDAEGNALLGEIQRQQNPVPHALGVPGPFGMRRDLNQLLADHRGSQRKRQLRVDCALQARKTAYRIVTDLAPRTIALHLRKRRDSFDDANPNDLPGEAFDLPIILLKCALGEEDTEMHPFVTEAMDKLLEIFKKVFLASDRKEIPESLVAPLLPSLLCAVCADSSLARVCAAKWAVEFIHRIDPAVARHISTFLADDGDPFVAAVAKKGLRNMPEIDVAMEDISRECRVSSLDLTNDGDNVSIQTDMDQKVNEFAVTMGLPKDAAGVVLGDYGFDTVKARRALECDRHKILADCGVVFRCDGVVSMRDIHGNATGGHFCEICYDEVGMDEIYQLPCEHKFCCSCWDEFLKSSLQGRPVASKRPLSVACPQQKCEERVTRKDVEEVAPHLVRQWDDITLRSFVDGSQCYSMCPDPDCTFAARSNEKRGTAPTCCSHCNTVFCFSCGNQAHQPARCSDFAEWSKIFTSSDFWVKKNAKPCPGCDVPIEKNNGCNHMQCSQCSYHFCWLCLGPLQSHLEPHICNRYEPHEGAENERERRALFFSDRFEAHESAAVYARTQAETIVEKREKFATETLWFVSEEDLDLRETAARTLVQARNFLKHSYVAAWAMKDVSDFPIRDIFEGYQANLELFTEKLSQLLLLTSKLHTMYAEEGARAIHMHFRAVTFSTASIEKYMGRILSLLEDEPETAT